MVTQGKSSAGGNPKQTTPLKNEEEPSACADTGRQQDAAPAAQDKSVKMISVIAATVFAVIALLVIYADAMAKQRFKRPPPLQSCPFDWIGFRGMCYYFSEEKQNWIFSQRFCSSQNALLLTFSPNVDMEFVMRYKGRAPFWIGLSREPNQPWKWANGENSVLEVIGEGGCAYISTSATPSTSSCSMKLFWICSKVEEKLCVET